jgi:hypothetical protein
MQSLYQFTLVFCTSYLNGIIPDNKNDQDNEESEQQMLRILLQITSYSCCFYVGILPS